MRIGRRILAVLKQTGKQMTTRQIADALGPPVSYDSVYQACRRLDRDHEVLRSEPSKPGEEVVWQFPPSGMIETARVEKKWAGPDVDVASGPELDAIGQSLGVERGWAGTGDGDDTEESDDSYREKIKEQLSGEQEDT